MKTKILTKVTHVTCLRKSNYERIISRYYFNEEKAKEFAAWCEENIKDCETVTTPLYCEDMITYTED